MALKRIRKNNIELKREVFVEMKQVCILRLLPSFWAFRWLGGREGGKETGEECNCDPELAKYSSHDPAAILLI